MSITLQVQKILYNAIKNDEYLAKLQCQMYTHIPDNSAFPYIHIDMIRFSQLPYKGNTKHYKGMINFSIHDIQHSNKQCINITDHLESVIQNVQFNQENFSIDKINTITKMITQDHKLNWYGNLESSIVCITN
jgi:hypothetical protein